MRCVQKGRSVCFSRDMKVVCLLLSRDLPSILCHSHDRQFHGTRLRPLSIMKTDPLPSLPPCFSFAPSVGVDHLGASPPPRPSIAIWPAGFRVQWSFSRSRHLQRKEDDSTHFCVENGCPIGEEIHRFCTVVRALAGGSTV